MNNTWKIYMLAFISFMVSTSEYVIAGILDEVAAGTHVSIPGAGQLITGQQAGAIGTIITGFSAALIVGVQLVVLWSQHRIVR